MLTKKGTSMVSLIPQVNNAYISIELPQSITGSDTGMTSEIYDSMVKDIVEFIQAEKRGSVTLEKCLTQIELHREHLITATTHLVECWVNNTRTQPKKRMSSHEKAQRDMLTRMNDKMLKLFASGVTGEDTVAEFIRPEDRVKLIDMVVVKMQSEEGK